MEDELKARKAKRRMEAAKIEAEIKEEHKEVEEKIQEEENKVDENVQKEEREIEEKVQEEETKEENENARNINDREQEIREEAKKEFEKEAEIKEQAKKELLDEQKREELKEYKSTARKRSVGRTIARIIWILVFLFILFETVIGILDMSRLNDDKEPVWYFSSKTEKVDNKTETTYNLGLYVIVKTTEGKDKKIMLKPFFLK